MSRKSRRIEIQKKSIFTYQTAIYVRCSMKSSIETQINLIKEYMKNKLDLEINDIYIDNGKTGTNFYRPEFIRMIKEITEGKINCVIVKDLSRLGRNYLEVGEFLEHTFPYYNVRFISINDNYDSLNNMEQEQLYTVILKNLMNDIYAKDISRKVRSAFLMKQKEGKYLGNYPPYGYLKDPKDKNKLIIDEETAPIVKQIFTWKKNDFSLGKIANLLNEKGVFSIQKYRYEKGLIQMDKYKNSIWSKKTITRDILRNSVYIGTIIQGKTRNELFQGIINKKVEKENWIIHKKMHQAIVSESLFYEVQRKLDGNKTWK